MPINVGLLSVSLAVPAPFPTSREPGHGNSCILGTSLLLIAPARAFLIDPSFSPSRVLPAETLCRYVKRSRSWNRTFTGLKDFMERLRKGTGSQVTEAVPHARHALGGVGKTQMAIK